MTSNEMFGDAVIVGILLVLAFSPLLLRFYPYLKEGSLASPRTLIKMNHNTMVAVIALALTYALGFIAIQVVDDIIEEHPNSTFEKDRIRNDKEFETLTLKYGTEKGLSPIKVAELDIKSDEGIRASLSHDKSYIHILRGGIVASLVLVISALVVILPFRILGTERPPGKATAFGVLFLAAGISLAFALYEENNEAELKYEKVVYHLWERSVGRGRAGSP